MERGRDAAWYSGKAALRAGRPGERPGGGSDRAFDVRVVADLAGRVRLLERHVHDLGHRFREVDLGLLRDLRGADLVFVVFRAVGRDVLVDADGDGGRRAVRGDFEA